MRGELLGASERLADGAPVPRQVSDASAPLDVEDVLVFQLEAERFRLTGGKGRGAGWAHIVDVALADNPLVDRAWNSGLPMRVSEPQRVHVAGPYWACNAVVVPVGQAHVVIFGSSTPIATSDAALFGAAARAVAETGAVTAEKLLADELELVHAVRALTSYQPRNVRDTSRHIATVAARALSCEMAAVQVRAAHHSTLEVLRVAANDNLDADPILAGRDAANFLEQAATLSDPIVEQTVGPDPEVWSAAVVSRMTLPIGTDSGLGALSLGHEAGHERGFTSLCQRIGRALAESAEPLLTQAIAHEQLAAEHEVLRRASETDTLTGIGNRKRWDAAIASVGSPAAGRGHAVLSIDLDDLKYINDHYGHASGDNVLRAVANILRSTLRAGDLIARVGGDEFLALLPDSGEREAQAAMNRIHHATRSWRVTEHGLTPSVSIGWAIVESDWDAAIAAADERMYADKHKRNKSAARRRTRTTRRSETARERVTDVAEDSAPGSG